MAYGQPADDAPWIAAAYLNWERLPCALLGLSKTSGAKKGLDKLTC